MSSSKGVARALAIVLGALATLALPAGAAAAQLLPSFGLLESLYFSVPAGFVLGMLGLFVTRRARLRLARTVYQEGRAAVRAARLLGFLGIYLATIGGIALAVYAVLRSRH